MFHGNKDSRENMVEEFFESKEQEDEEQEKKDVNRPQTQYNSLKFDTFNPVKNVNPKPYEQEDNTFKQPQQLKFSVPLPLKREDVEKYVYAQQDPHELSTPGRITNPDNASQSQVTIEQSPLPNFAAAEEKQLHQSKFKGRSNTISERKQAQGSDVDLNYSFSQLGGAGGRSTLKKSASQAIPKQDEKARSGKIAQDVLEFQKMVTQQYKKKYQESDKMHRDILGLSQHQEDDIQQQKKKQDEDNFLPQQEQNTSLADVFRARKFQMLSKFQNRKVIKDAEYQKKKSSASSTVSGRSKEQILKLRKEMMRPKNKPASEGDSPVEQQTHKESELMRRLAMGEKVKLSKKEMHNLSSKNYQKLPQIQKQKEELLKKEMIKQKQEKMRQFDQQRKLDLNKKKNKKQ